MDVPIQETNIQLICDANGPPPSLLPSSAYVDVSNAAVAHAQGMCQNNFFISYTIDDIPFHKIDLGLLCGAGGMSFTTANGTPLLGVSAGAPIQPATFASLVSGKWFHFYCYKFCFLLFSRF